MYLYELLPAKISGTMRKVIGRATGNLVKAAPLAVPCDFRLVRILTVSILEFLPRHEEVVQ